MFGLRPSKAERLSCEELLVRLYETGDPTALINVTHLSLTYPLSLMTYVKNPTIAIFVKLINGFYTA